MSGTNPDAANLNKCGMAEHELPDTRQLAMLEKDKIKSIEDLAGPPENEAAPAERRDQVVDNEEFWAEVPPSLISRPDCRCLVC